MLLKLSLFIFIFIIGEIVCNLTWFRYIKKYFEKHPSTQQNPTKENSPPFVLTDISIFKGILERTVLYLGLLLGHSQVLIVFGAIKIGTRFDKNQKILNDYFIIGNFSSILIAILYSYLYGKILKLYN